MRSAAAVLVLVLAELRSCVRPGHARAINPFPGRRFRSGPAVSDESIDVSTEASPRVRCPWTVTGRRRQRQSGQRNRAEGLEDRTVLQSGRRFAGIKARQQHEQERRGWTTRGGSTQNDVGAGDALDAARAAVSQREDAPPRDTPGERSEATSMNGDAAGADARRDTASTAGAAAAAPKHIDAKEEKLRHALMTADGPSRILREVERIPALRRLSDSALRITSATESDGRLAALALYRLGAEARKAENALTQEASSTPSGSAGAATKSASAREAGISSEAPTRGDDGAAAPTTTAAALSKRKEEKPAFSASTAPGASLEKRHQDEAHGAATTGGQDKLTAGGIHLESRKPGAAGGVEADSTASAAASSGCVKSPVENAGDKQKGDDKQGASGSSLAASNAPTLAPTGGSAAAFDADRVKTDQRFEQLVEIVECVASTLSISDTSKVVWGLSILRYVPSRGLLESLAATLTERLRQEGEPDPQPSAADPRMPSNEASLVPSAGFTEGNSSSPASGASGTSSTDLKSSAAPVAPTAFQPPPAAATWANDADDVTASAVAEGGTPAESSAGAVELARDTESGQSLAGGAADMTPRATKPVQVTCGTDLATAALSFTYAHARLEVSTIKLLEIIASRVTPQLASMPLRDLANLAWAFAAQRYCHDEVMAGIAREIVSDRAGGRMSAKDTAIFAWAYGVLGCEVDKVTTVLMREGLATMDEASPHDLSNLAWGLARAKIAVDAHAETDDAVGMHPREAAPTAQDYTSYKIGEHDRGRDEEEFAEGEAADLEGGEERGHLDGREPWGLGWVLGRARAMRPRGDPRPGGEEVVVNDDGGSDEPGIRGLARDCSMMADPSARWEQREGGGVEVGGDVGSYEPRGEEGMLESRGAKASMEQRLGEAVLARACDGFRQFQPKQLSRLCWALGAWHGRGVVLQGAGPFAARALTEAGQHPKEYTAEELAEVLWSFATIVGNADSPAQELAGLLGALAEGFEAEGAKSVAGRGLEPSTACDVLWSFATMGHPAHSLCEAMARDLVDQVQELPPASVASLAWAYAKMGHPAAELMERVLSVVERKLDDFTVEDASCALWALGALGYSVSLKRQFDVTKEDLRSLNPSALANLLWGLTKTGAAFAEGFDRECLEAIAADMGPKLLSFSPRELCRTAWALGRLGLGGVFFRAGGGDGGEADDDGAARPEGGEMPRLMDKLLGECSKWLELFTPQELETLLWAICRLEHRADDLVGEMALEAKRHQEDLLALLQQSGPTAARDAAFHLGAFRHLLTKYRSIDFEGRRAKERHRRGSGMLSRMFRER